MKRLNFIRIIVVLSVACGLANSAFAWRFAVMADSRGLPPGGVSSVLNKIVAKTIEDKPVFVVFVGDLILGSSEYTPLKYQLATWKKAVAPFAKAGIKLYPVIGNHEVYGKARYSARQERICRDMLGLPADGAVGYKNLAYAFDYENAKFIVLDSDLAGDEFEKITGGQFTWLEKQLIGNKKKYVFVFFHEPAFPVGPHKGSSLDANPKNKAKLWKLLTKYKVTAVFNGHEHLYNRSLHKGVWQIIAGTCGAPIYRGYGGEFYHYAIVDVDGDDVNMTVKDVDGNVRDKIPLTDSYFKKHKPIFSFAQISGDVGGQILRAIDSLKSKPDFIFTTKPIVSKWDTHNIGGRYYAFTDKGVAFIVIDTQKLDKQQISWLEDTLKRSKGSRYVCVFGSKPLSSYGRGKKSASKLTDKQVRKMILKMMRKYGVDLYVSANSERDYYKIGENVNSIGVGKSAVLRIYTVYPDFIVSKFETVGGRFDEDKTYYCPKIKNMMTEND